MSPCPVLFLYKLLTEFQSFPIRKVVDDDDSDPEVAAFKAVIHSHDHVYEDDYYMSEVFEKKNYNLSESGCGKFQYMLDSFRTVPKNNIRGPDNNLEEYPVLDADEEKAKAKFEEYKDSCDSDLTWEDCLSHSTLDDVYYRIVTQRKYDVFKAWWILYVLRYTKKPIDYLDFIHRLIGFDFTGDATLLDFVTDCYIGIDNTDMEF